MPPSASSTSSLLGRARCLAGSERESGAAVQADAHWRLLSYSSNSERSKYSPAAPEEKSQTSPGDATVQPLSDSVNHRSWAGRLNGVLLSSYGSSGLHAFGMSIIAMEFLSGAFIQLLQQTIALPISPQLITSFILLSPIRAYAKYVIALPITTILHKLFPQLSQVHFAAAIRRRAEEKAAAAGKEGVVKKSRGQGFLEKYGLAFMIGLRLGGFVFVLLGWALLSYGIDLEALLEKYGPQKAGESKAAKVTGQLVQSFIFAALLFPLNIYLSPYVSARLLGLVSAYSKR